MRAHVAETITGLREHAQDMLDVDWQVRAIAENPRAVEALARDVAQGFKLIAKALEEIGRDR